MKYYFNTDINSYQELFEVFDKMRELTVQSTPTTKLELAYDEVQYAITVISNELTEEDEEFLVRGEVVALHNLADAIKARIDFANQESEDDSDDDYYDDLNDDSDYDEDDIDDLYIELKERNDLISKLQTKIANLEKVTEDTRRVDDSIKRERERVLKNNAMDNHPVYKGELQSINDYLTGGMDKLDNELENNLKQATDLLSSFEDHLRRR